MSLLGSIALVLLTLVGYSSGVTLAARPRDIAPAIADLLLFVVTATAVFWLRTQLGFGHLPSFALGVSVGVAMGFLRTKLRLRRDQSPAALPTSELPEHAREQTETAPTTSNPFRRAWQAWSQFAGEMGNVQGRMFMGYFYFIVVMPFALGAKLLSDPLDSKKQPDTSGWHGREPVSTTLESTREQG